MPAIVGFPSRRLSTRAFVLCLITLASLLLVKVPPAHAVDPYSVNTIVNPSFEMPLVPTWEPDVYNDGNYYSTITTDNAIRWTGSYSARLDVSTTSTAINKGPKNITQPHLNLVHNSHAKPYLNNPQNQHDAHN